jgi:hypothetical protein
MEPWIAWCRKQQRDDELTILLSVLSNLLMQQDSISSVDAGLVKAVTGLLDMQNGQVFQFSLGEFVRVTRV